MNRTEPSGATPAQADAEHLATLTPDPALAAQVRLISLLGSEAPLDNQLEALARYVESMAPNMRCGIMRADETGQMLVQMAAPSLPVAFRERIARVPIGPEVGACGSAAALLEVVIVHDIASSPQCASWQAAAGAAGIRACWSVPFTDGQGQLLGTFALYYDTCRAPSPAERSLLDLCAGLARIVTCRHRDTARSLQDQHQLRERSALERQALEAAEDERERLANDLNNGVCQQLAGIDYLISASVTAAEPAMAESWRDIQRQLQLAVHDTSLLASWMLPLTTWRGGLREALETLAGEVLRRWGKSVVIELDAAAVEGLSTTDSELVLRTATATLRLAASDAFSTRIALRLALPAGQPHRLLQIEVDSMVLASAGARAALGGLFYRAWRGGGVLRLEPAGELESRARLTLLDGSQPRSP